MTDGKVRQPNERQRALAAVDLRIQGHTYSHIAETLGYRDHSGAYRAVTRLLDRRENEAVDTLRKVHGERLSGLLAAVWTRAVGGDDDAIKTALSVLGDIAKLHGLNAPQRVNVGITEAEFASQAGELLAVVGEAPLRELARRPSTARALPDVDGEVVVEPSAPRPVGEVVHSEVYRGEVTDGWSNIGSPDRLQYDTGTSPPVLPDADAGTSPPVLPDADAGAPPGAVSASGVPPIPTPTLKVSQSRPHSPKTGTTANPTPANPTTSPANLNPMPTTPST